MISMSLHDFVIGITWISMFLFIVILSAFSQRFIRKFGAFDRSECARKAVHMGSGLLLVALPFYTSSPWVGVMIACLAGVVLLAMKRISATSAVWGFLFERRRGAWWYVLSIAGLSVLLPEHGAIFSVSFLILAVPDVVAAFLGMSYGRRGFLRKSLVGFVGHFVAVMVVLTMWCGIFLGKWEQGSWIFVVAVAGITSLVESVSIRGSDNFTVPFASAATLLLLWA